MTGSALEGYTEITEIIWVKMQEPKGKQMGQRKEVTEMSGLYSRRLYGGSVDR